MFTGFKSQHGEDNFILSHHLVTDEFVVIDVGANDGQSWSNSYIFGQLGARLILVEPNPKYAEQCRVLFRHNNNVFIEEFAISDRFGSSVFYLHDDDSGDPLSMRSSLSRANVPSSKVTEISVNTVPLSSIIKKYNIGNRYFLLSVDAEGHDLEVIKNASLDKNRPKYICIEDDINQNEIEKFLFDNQYQKLTKLMSNGIYVDKLGTDNIEMCRKLNFFHKMKKILSRPK
jgi:FkbM family methyltransferase